MSSLWSCHKKKKHSNGNVQFQLKEILVLNIQEKEKKEITGRERMGRETLILSEVYWASLDLILLFLI